MKLAFLGLALFGVAATTQASAQEVRVGYWASGASAAISASGSIAPETTVPALATTQHGSRAVRS